MVLDRASYTDRLTGAQREYAMLAERHMQHDLEPSDRDLLKTAAKKLGTHTTVGASLGLGLGLLLTYRLRRATYQIYNAARSVEKPVAFQFKDGHTVPFPQNATDAFRPNTASGVITGFLFGIAGFFLGGELGLLTGSASAAKTIAKDPSAKGRIEHAFRSLRADMLRGQADALERRESFTAEQKSKLV